jgi:hypothetical protein
MRFVSGLLGLVLAAVACASSSPSQAPAVVPPDGGATTSDAAVTDAGAEAGLQAISIACERPDEIVALPAANDTAQYRSLSPARYQFGRCELVALLLDGARDALAAMPDRGPVGIGDLSEQSGAIPGTDEDKPRHPAPSHTNGFSVDVTYWRMGGRSLEDSPACPSKTREFCDGAHDVDVPATAALFAMFARSGRVVQIIVDPIMESDLGAALDTLVSSGVAGAAGARKVLVSGIPFHADHFHISLSRACFDGEDNDGDGLVDLDDPDCANAVDDDEAS